MHFGTPLKGIHSEMTGEIGRKFKQGQCPLIRSIWFALMQAYCTPSSPNFIEKNSKNAKICKKNAFF